MKKYSSFFLLLVIIWGGINVYAQQYQVKGKVIGGLSNKPVEFVNVMLMKKDSIYSGAVTDSLGVFTIIAPKGDYTLKLEYFEEVFTNKDVNISSNTDLGLLKIKESIQLEEIVIDVKKTLIKREIDRLVFNVENSAFVKGGTAYDVLKTTPTIRVQNNNIVIVGKGQVLVMIDDRIQRLSQDDLVNLLKSIPSDKIKSIEVITTPPAKYDAEGNSGLINIKLKTARANSWSANIGTSYTQRNYASGSIQGLFNYNHNKLALQTSISKGKEKLLTTSDNRIFYTDELWEQKVKNKSESDVWSLGLGIDYKLTNKWTSGIKYLRSFTDKNVKNNPLTTRYNNGTNEINSYVVSDVNSNNNPEMNSLNWYYTIKLDTLGKNVTFDFDYFHYKKKDNRFFIGNELDNIKNIILGSYFSSTNNNLNKIQNYSGKIDFTFPFKWANISFGGKMSYTNTNNNLAVFDNETGAPVLNTEQSNIFNYKEYNEALYFSASKKIGEKWESQMGLRIESTQTEGYSENLNQTNKNDYIKLFPTAYLTYKANDNNLFSLNYSRRIRRPDFDYLNPFIIRTSPYFYSEGNPYLKPSFIDNLEFSYIYNQKWVNSIYYSQVSDFGQQLSIVDENTNITRRTPINYANTYQIGFSTYYNFNKWSWWNSFSGFNVNYQNVKSKVDFIKSIHGYNGFIFSNNEFTLNTDKTISLGLNYALQLPGRNQIFHISTINVLDVSLKLLLLNQNLSITITGEDLLNGQRSLMTYYSNGVKNDIKNYDDTRGIRISLSYKFGNNNIASNKRDFGNEDERNRTN